ncbi:MAG: ArsC/Spx/MgsR family protein [Sporichthyaceae bacterium]
MEIWLNPACSKCRSATEALDAAGVAYTVRRYLDDPPSEAEIADVLARLTLEPWDIARLGEAEAIELGIATWPRESAHRARWIAALAAHPALVQRPIITAADGTTVVARSPEALSAAVDAEARVGHE